MMASAAYAGDFTTDDILARKDAEGITVGEALDSIGYRGASAVGARKFAAFVELHIEQGPILEAENKTIGVVDSGQGVLWYDGKITGFESHAGTTPMPLRRDALATLSEIVLAMERDRKAHGPKAVGTVGEAVIATPSRNVIPGEIAFTVDCRSADADIMGARQGYSRGDRGDRGAAQGRGQLDLVWRKPPTLSMPNWSMPWRMPPKCSAIRTGASPRAPVTMPATSTQCDAGGDGVRALQGRHQPQ